MSKYTKTQLDKVVKLMLDGMGAAAARAQVGVSHTPAELHVFRFQWLVAELPQPGTGPWTFSTQAVVYLRFHALDDRGKLGWGIGKIMVALDATEGQVRKAIREGANVHDRGHRTGKGGRYYGDEPRLYADLLKQDGTRIRLDSDEDAVTQAERQRLMKLDFAQLKAEAAAEGVPMPKKPTRAQLVTKLMAQRAG